ncbi:microprocessor complex subunit DGCR8 isoform X1 [Stomoxys calcitrans]|uniref:microprocessor complex subunit DGCR8 isoform X1 n=1 Tax=Stomoxys calcitrans TaxID=35570 RepID=UPI0027E323F1|nr:microprocessor complex subunit DGCR8 isoform X1 [Stomoxys calcitrans]XP_013108981.2 microprocessor complex subunit DGCR8 isoform X1 [Stomoxys calcitrans]XP_013108982.2 microprocessor complex subunit DGCR8 isoform X1 [Stomoxys calcitrans]XP_013108983.2 microprocessor complex subunit DGCR8 isoform X1 [Stomoxys calcitrans]XP_013108984.2 microprocessor complex subunit DGCR8 isoform X1 [Stomoxys calcitrans]
MSSHQDASYKMEMANVKLAEREEPENKRVKLTDEAESCQSLMDDHAKAMKNAGFSLSAIEEMRNRAEEDSNSQALDQQLRHFQVLDEVGSNSDDDEEDNGSENGDGAVSSQQNGDDDDAGDESSELDLDDEEIEHLLDENLPDDLKGSKKPKYEERFKTVLEEKRHNHFEVLPEGWVQVTHNSGMPLYLHKKTRVISTTRPYFLGTGSARKHAIPVGSIPCLNYRRALAEEAEAEQRKAQEITSQEEAATDVVSSTVSSSKCPFGFSASSNLDDISSMTSPPAPPLPTQQPSATEVEGEQNSLPSSNNGNTNENESSSTTTADANSSIGNTVDTNSNVNKDKLRSLVPAAKIVTVNENIQKESLTPDQFNQYCQKIFKFRVIRVLRFRSWNARRKFTKNRKNLKNIQRPTLPDGTKLIKFPVLVPGDGKSNPRARREWIMNPSGKSFVCILHEYVQHALKKQPTYEFKELENAATPYAATVSINDLKYGTGYGTSKRQAKSEAARETLEILIPEMKDKITGVKQDKSAVAKSNQKDLSVFDDIRIEDPRVTEFCNKTTEPTPHAILLTCLQRNYGLGDDVQINYEINRTHSKKNEFTMTVGKHTAKVLCKNKREGKQLASQAILQILHPHIKTWGSLLRLYGNNSIKTFKEKKQEEQEITVLQSKAAINQPNYAILDKLRMEMLKLSEKNKSVLCKGTFIPPSDVDLPSSSGSNLNNVEL